MDQSKEDAPPALDGESETGKPFTTNMDEGILPKDFVIKEEAGEDVNVKLEDLHHSIDIKEEDCGVNEVTFTVSECKLKWNNSFRNSYSRCLREPKIMPSGPGSSKRKKLNDYIGQHRPTTSNVFSQSLNKNSIINENDAALINQSKKPNLASVIGAVAVPMIEFLKSRTHSQFFSKDSTTEFLSSLVPDVNLLTPQKQRHYKLEVLSMLNNMLDDQEADAGRYKGDDNMNLHQNEVAENTWMKFDVS